MRRMLTGKSGNAQENKGACILRAFHDYGKDCCWVLFGVRLFQRRSQRDLITFVQLDQGLPNFCCLWGARQLLLLQGWKVSKSLMRQPSLEDVLRLGTTTISVRLKFGTFVFHGCLDDSNAQTSAGLGFADLFRGRDDAAELQAWVRRWNFDVCLACFRSLSQSLSLSPPCCKLRRTGRPETGDAVRIRWRRTNKNNRVNLCPFAVKNHGRPSRPSFIMETSLVYMHGCFPHNLSQVFWWIPTRGGPDIRRICGHAHLRRGV